MSSQPTAVKDLYNLPQGFINNYNYTENRRSIIQNLVDHMRFYLGILEPIHAILVEKFCESFDFTVGRRGVASAVVRHPFAIQYSGRKNIAIENVERFSCLNLCACIAHECTRHYMEIHSIEVKDADNKMLIDMTAAYLGFGFILLKGYETKDTSMGYLSNHSIKEVIHISSKLREWPTSSLLNNFESIVDKLRIGASNLF
jgi:hypothetical protein